MADNDFGTPDAEDATSRGERTVQEAAQYIVDLGEQAKREVQNRPLGSVKISPQQRRQEWELMKDNPEHLSQFFTDQKATVEQMVKFAKDMLK